LKSFIPRFAQGARHLQIAPMLLLLLLILMVKISIDHMRKHLP
jgi:hypothetical protein